MKLADALAQVENRNQAIAAIAKLPVVSFTMPQLLKLHTMGVEITGVLVLGTVLQLEAIEGPRAGLTDVVETLAMPFSTVSRVVWDLSEKHRLLAYIPHATDRRKKLLAATPKLLKLVAQAR